MAPAFIPCVFAFLLTVHAATALTCYNCNSKNSATCAWGITSFTYPTETCENSFIDSVISRKCYKITAESKDGSEMIARGCLPSGVIGCNAIASAAGWLTSQSSNEPESLKNVQCDTCESDKCNSAQRLAGVTIVGLILAAAIFAF